MFFPRNGKEAALRFAPHAVPRGRIPFLAAIAVALLTAAAFLPALDCGFINIDDFTHVSGNPAVLNGITPDGVRAAFRVFENGYWTPVLFLSFMTDAQVFGDAPRGFHLVNVLLHSANAALLFLLLNAALGRIAPSLLAALLFSLHPLRVESVVWVTQRKDVLSAFLFLLALAAYARFSHGTGTPRRLWYGLSLALFVLGLMTKPTLVVFPALLVIVDLWPLGRLPLPARPFGKWFRDNRRTLAEKIPFFLLSAIVSAVTLVLQENSFSTSGREPDLLVRALVMFFPYLGQMTCLTRLGFRFLDSVAINVGETGLQAVLMHVLMLVLLWRARSRHPYLLAAWLWYLVALLPAAGAAPMGIQWTSDRFTYIPMMGLCAAIAAGLDAAVASRRGRLVAGLLSVVALAGLFFGTRSQIRHWEDGRAFALRAVEISPVSPTALVTLGNAYFIKGEMQLARSAMEKAVELAPLMAEAQGGLGMVLFDLGDGAGKTHLEEAIRLGFDDPSARYRLGRMLFEEGDIERAMENFQAGLRAGMSPSEASVVHRLIGVSLERFGRLEEAVAQLQTAVSLLPSDAGARADLGRVLLASANPMGAEPQLTEAVRLAPENLRYRLYLAKALAALGRPEEAAEHLQVVARTSEGTAASFLARGLLERMGGRERRAIEMFRAGLGAPSSDPETLDELNAALSKVTP